MQTMKEKYTFSFGAVFLCACIFFLTSCVNTKKVTYFNNISDTELPAQESPIPVIQNGDLLSISVTSLSPDVTTIFNAPNNPAGSSYLSGSILAQAVGYLVDRDGDIDFPMLGTLKAAGLTEKTLKDSIAHKLEDRKLLFDPIVTVRLLNFHVTVLGEVNNPGVVTIPNEQVTLLEAIGMAGDITIYGKRDNVLLVRKEDG